MIGPLLACLALAVLFSVFLGHFAASGHEALLHHQVGSAWAWALLALLALLPAVPVALYVLATGSRIKKGRLTSLPARGSARRRTAFLVLLFLLYPAVQLVRDTVGRDLSLVVVPVVAAVWFLFLAAVVACAWLVLQTWRRSRA